GRARPDRHQLGGGGESDRRRRRNNTSEDGRLDLRTRGRRPAYQAVGGISSPIRSDRVATRASTPAADTALVQSILEQVAKRVVGQDYMVERLLVGLLAGGHVLLEGLPGLAKTLTVKTIAEAIQTSFQRIQFTPDLLPADVLGTQIFD